MIPTRLHFRGFYCIPGQTPNMLLVLESVPGGLLDTPWNCKPLPEAVLGLFSSIYTRYRLNCVKSIFISEPP